MFTSAKNIQERIGRIYCKEYIQILRYIMIKVAYFKISRGGGRGASVFRPHFNLSSKKL